MEINPSAYSVHSAVFVANKLSFHCAKWVLLKRNTLVYYLSSTGLISSNAKKNMFFFPPPTDAKLKLVPRPIARVIKGSYDLVIYWIVILVTNVHFLALAT
jgi:hypothetical protein